MKADYDCLKCEHRFAIDVSESVLQSSLAPNRTDTCPKCAQRVGTGPISCRSCGATFTLAFPHWHMHCDLARGNCPECVVEHVSMCVC